MWPHARHEPGTRDFDPALYRVSWWQGGHFQVSDPLTWEAAEDEFLRSLFAPSRTLPHFWTERQWQARQAAMAHADKALTS